MALHVLKDFYMRRSGIPQLESIFHMLTGIGNANGAHFSIWAE